MIFGGQDGMWGTIGQLGQDEVNAQLRTAFDAGVNFIDTANGYAHGRSEMLVGEGLDQNLGIMVWSRLSGGLLTGAFHPDGSGPPGARRANFDFPVVHKPRAFACVDAMRPIAERHGVSMARFALAWLLSRQAVSGGHRRREVSGTTQGQTRRVFGEALRRRSDSPRQGQRSCARVPRLDDRAAIAVPGCRPGLR